MISPTEESVDSVYYGEPGMSIAPVPATSQFNIIYKTLQSGNAVIIILDELGNQVMQKTTPVAVGKNNFNMNIGQLPNGIYFVKLSDGKNIFVKKLVVQK